MVIDRPTIDIVIPTYKPGEKFLRLLTMLEAQSLPYRKLIVANTEVDANGASVRSSILSVLKDAEKLQFLRVTPEEFDHAGTRNMAIRQSDAEIVVCMTDDAVPQNEELLEQLAKALCGDETLAAAYARQLADADCGAAEQYTRLFNYPEVSRKKTIADLPALGIKTYFASNVCCAYRRAIYEELGGFVDTAIFNEDMLYAAKALKAGYGTYYCAEAMVIHAHNYRALQQFHRNFDLGMSQAMHPEVFDGVRSEGEGVKLVLSTTRWMLQNGMLLKIPDMIVKSGCKYLGFKLGRAYRKLPDSLVLRFAMNKTYVKRLLKAGTEN